MAMSHLSEHAHSVVLYATVITAQWWSSLSAGLLATIIPLAVMQNTTEQYTTLHDKETLNEAVSHLILNHTTLELRWWQALLVRQRDMMQRSSAATCDRLQCTRDEYRSLLCSAVQCSAVQCSRVHRPDLTARCIRAACHSINIIHPLSHHVTSILPNFIPSSWYPDWGDWGEKK